MKTRRSLYGSPGRRAMNRRDRRRAGRQKVDPDRWLAAVKRDPTLGPDDLVVAEAAVALVRRGLPITDDNLFRILGVTHG